MNRCIAPVLALVLLACQGSFDSPREIVPNASLKRVPDCAVRDVEDDISNDWCNGGNVWWSVDGHLYTTACATDVSIRAYSVDSHGARRYFASDEHPTGEPNPLGMRWTFALQGLAAPDSIPDLHDAGYPPNYGFVHYSFDVFAGNHRDPIGAYDFFSDVPLTANLGPGPRCKGLPALQETR